MPAAKLERRPMTEDEYLALNTNRGAEFTDGFLDFLPSPDEEHCEINYWIVLALRAALARTGNGVVRQCPFRLKSTQRTIEHPMPACYSTETRLIAENFIGAMPILSSKSSASRDYQEKRIDYASAGVPEYWIIDPRVRRITQLKFENGTYVEVGVFSDGHQIRSFTMPELRLMCVSVLTRATRRRGIVSRGQKRNESRILEFRNLPHHFRS